MVDAFSHRNNVLFYYTIIFLNSNKNFRKTLYVPKEIQTLYFFRNIPERALTRYATQPKSGTRIFPDSDTTRF